jgi:hypothetical protein
MPVWKVTDIWLVSAAQTADWPRLAEAWGSLEHDLALQKKPLRGFAGRVLSHLVFHIAACEGEVADRGEGSGEVQFVERRAALEG